MDLSDYIISDGACTHTWTNIGQRPLGPCRNLVKTHQDLLFHATHVPDRGQLWTSLWSESHRTRLRYMGDHRDHSTLEALPRAASEPFPASHIDATPVTSPSNPQWPRPSAHGWPTLPPRLPPTTKTVDGPPTHGPPWEPHPPHHPLPRA